MPDKDDAGDWQGLDSPRQAPRYAAIADIINGFRPNGDVLDIGCGEAVLLDYLQNNFNYHGIEPSAKAIRLALERNPTAKIYHSSSENFDPQGRRFDIIVFNEVLYYTSNPIGLIQKYSALLREGGAILCSIYQKPGRVSSKKKLLHWIDHRRPIDNVHCTKMVQSFMKRKGWHIIHYREVPIPESPSQWFIWLTIPQ